MRPETFKSMTDAKWEEIKAFTERMEKANPNLRGFARNSKEKQKQIASAGGIASQKKNGCNLTDDQRSAGGETTSSDRDHMAKIGKKGGIATLINGNTHVFTPEEIKKGAETREKVRRIMATVVEKESESESEEE